MNVSLKRDNNRMSPDFRPMKGAQKSIELPVTRDGIAVLDHTRQEVTAVEVRQNQTKFQPKLLALVAKKNAATDSSWALRPLIGLRSM